ncbi:nascent polypeptide associated complex alpha chain with an NAC domain [Cryptosporidium bovis]|uniref:nascent polypeptide associated complex alpha chain with an NAC domain n=1 Tax=Cryptosporidium bovis TaxID=310047 RepID=UPI00351A7011|nr:nascent polypeptide associated complex alpha chain with an NAC domain [Cryptosporidium bovis]
MAGDNEPKIVEVQDQDQISSAGVSSEDEEVTGNEVEGGTVRHRNNKGERKNRKLIQKLGLKPMTDFEKIVIRGARGLSFQIVNPEVYVVPGNRNYIIFGDAKLEDRNATSQAAALANATSQLEQKLAAMKTSQENNKQSSSSSHTASIHNEHTDHTASIFPSGNKDESHEDIDESDVDPANIDLVVSQTGCSRSKAVQALKLNNHDVVEAILYLSP